MRPNSIVWFERVVLVWLLVGAATMIVMWDNTAAAWERAGLSSSVGLVATFASFMVYGLLLWFITRRGSKVAAWIYVVFGAINIVSLVSSIAAWDALGPLTAGASIVQFALTIATLVLLAKKESRNWLSGKHDPQYDQVFD